jgi:hypothetical protein
LDATLVIASAVTGFGEGLGLTEDSGLPVGRLDVADPPQLTRSIVAMISAVRISI